MGTENTLDPFEFIEQDDYERKRNTGLVSKENVNLLLSVIK